MKIALLGYGKMGKEIEKISIERGHSISIIKDKNDTVNSIDNVDVAINFSTPDSAVDNIKLAQKAGLKCIEVECDTLEQVAEALDNGADRILLDNMSNKSLSEAVKLSAGRTPLEASGGVSLKTVRAVAETGIDFISVGRITQSARAVDIGLDLLS